LLVLVDGRAVYTPLFGGVYWDTVDVPLEDIERIEVIRGPGAAMWGANAVNGVINVITKSAAETQGGLFSAVVGSEERVIDTLRYGVPAGDCGFLRVYGKWSEHDSLHQTSASVADDGWQQGRVGMRGDWNPTTKDAFTVLGDAYRGSFDGSVLQNSPTAPFQQTVAEDGFASGANLIGRWTRTSDPHSSATLQFFVDTYRRESTGTSQQIDTQDLDYQQHLRLNDWNDVTFGMGYRRFETKFRGTFDVALQDPNSYDDVTSAFVQDDLTLVKERLTLSLGSKFEYNDFTHFEPQPDARLVYTPDEKQTWWAAASRAVRTPSVIEDDGKLSLSVQPGAPPTQVELYGNPALHAENVTAYQLGWRVRPSETTSLDLTAFFNEYSRLVTFETGTPFLNANGNLEVPQTFGNEMHGRTEGIEAAGEWRVAPSWTLHAGYAFLAIHVETSPSSTDTTSVHETSSSFPDHQVQLRSLWNVTDKVEFDVGVTYVDSVPQYGAPAYVRADARLGWRISDRTDLSLTAQSLFHDDQPEFGAQLIVVPTEPQTGIYLKFTHRF
jgi:iron complex outermembrane receptor protein